MYVYTHMKSRPCKPSLKTFKPGQARPGGTNDANDISPSMGKLMRTTCETWPAKPGHQATQTSFGPTKPECTQICAYIYILNLYVYIFIYIYIRFIYIYYIYYMFSEH